MFRAGEKAGKPFGIKFEVSAKCNLRCIMCPLSKGLKRKQGFLKFDNFKKIYDEITPSYLNLTGIGEPLLNPDLFKIIKYASKKGTMVKLDTNATLLNKENSKKLLKTKPNIISVSIDGSDKKTYEKIRRGAKFDEVINNLKNFVNQRNKNKSRTKIHVNFVLLKENIKNIVKFIRYVDSLGVDSINGDIALPLGGNKNIKERNIDKKTIEKTKKELKSLNTLASLNIEHVFDFLNYGWKNPKKYRKKVCFYPWYYPSITWDGFLIPCCYVSDNEVVFGNVLKDGFMNVWNGEKIRKFRESLSKKRQGFCKNCFIDETFIADKIWLISKMPLIGLLSKRKWK
jgi:radical SAM protein with 4Fe4S-binding SPASM domain